MSKKMSGRFFSMKKFILLFALSFSAVLLVSCQTSGDENAPVNIDYPYQVVPEDNGDILISAKSEEALNEFLNKIPADEKSGGDKTAIQNGSAETAEPVVLLDQKDIYVEFRGISDYTSDYWIINLYIENHRDSEIIVELEDVLINKFAISLGDNGISIPANGKYLAKPNFDFIIVPEDLAAYDMTALETLDFNLNIRDESSSEDIVNQPVTLELK